MLCIIHVGLHHTGTTSFQNFLNFNREILLNNNILYPLSGNISCQHSLIPGAFIPNHHALDIPRKLDPNHYLDMIKNECLSAKYEVCILSSEVFTELCSKDIQKCKELINKISSYFEETKLMITNRDYELRALSQSKAMIRRSKFNPKHRKEIFNAAKLFKNKLNAPTILIENWKKIFRNVEVIVMDEKNTIPKYFDYIVKHISSKTKEKLYNYLPHNKDKFFDIFVNKDIKICILYLLTYLLGYELSNDEDYIKQKLTFSFIEDFFIENSQIATTKLNKINNQTLLKYLYCSEQDLASYKLDEFFFRRFLNLSSYESFFLEKLKEECKYKLFND